MNEELIRNIRQQTPRMAICYDFDKTLSPDDMQTFTLIPSFGMENQEFWDESNKLAKDNLMDKNLAWMFQLIQYSKIKRLPIKKEYFHEMGSNIPLYKGVTAWFDRINKYASQNGIELEHYIISSGLKEIIEGSSIASNFKRIYASSYLYSTDGVAEWPAQAINYTNKTQYIFRIAKGFLDEFDDRVNKSMSDSELKIPYENIIYIGDSETDIPSMRLVKSKGGYSIGVFDPQKNNRKNVYQLYNDGRINFYAPADYSARAELSVYIKQIIDEISAREKMKTEQKILQINPDLFRTATNLSDFISFSEQYESPAIKKNQLKKLKEAVEELKNTIDGNID